MPEDSKKQRRDQAREHAKAMREAEAKRKRRNRIFVQSGIAVVLVAIVAVVVLVVVPALTPKPVGPGPKNMASDGILFSGDGKKISPVSTPSLKPSASPVPTDVSKYSKVVRIVEYIDFGCPYCNAFETANADTIKQWVTAGIATLEIHPVTIRDASFQGTEYSTRGGNAAVCVANYDPNSFLDVTKALYAKQPAEGTSGLPNSELVSIVQSAGVTSSKVASCINNGTYDAWIKAATVRAEQKIPNSSGVTLQGTPTILVNGVQYNSQDSSGKYADFVSFVQQAAAAAGGSASASPTPSPSN